MANGVRYGLAASVFSENVGRAMKAAAKLDFGTVWINEHLFPLTSEMPHGGFKESGYGKDMSIYSMEEYTASSTSRSSSARRTSRRPIRRVQHSAAPGDSHCDCPCRTLVVRHRLARCAVIW